VFNNKKTKLIKLPTQAVQILPMLLMSNSFIKKISQKRFKGLLSMVYDMFRKQWKKPLINQEKGAGL
jgi:hypothetical protein